MGEDAGAMMPWLVRRRLAVVLTLLSLGRLQLVCRTNAFAFEGMQASPVWRAVQYVPDEKQRASCATCNCRCHPHRRCHVVPSNMVASAASSDVNAGATKKEKATTKTTTTTMLEWQDGLVATASQPLVPTSLDDALHTLQRDGVVRIDSKDLEIIDKDELCDKLRERILKEVRSGRSRWGTAETEVESEKKNGDNNGGTTTSNKFTDRRYVPGTRIRFVEPIDVAFSGVSRRHDLLLPLAANDDNNNGEDGWPEVLLPLLSSVAGRLSNLLNEAAECMLPRLMIGGVDDDDYDGHDEGQSPSLSSSLEIVEVGSLLSCHGSTTQALHGDYRRYHYSTYHQNNGNPQQQPRRSSKTNSPSISSSSSSMSQLDNEDLNSTEPPSMTASKRMGKLPPRLVTFVALQDVPDVQHGATAFITGTHNARAHETVYGRGERAGIDIRRMDDDDDDSNDGNDLDDDASSTIMAALEGRQFLLGLSNFTAGGVRTASAFKKGDVLIYDSSVLHWGGPNSIPDNDRAILYFGVARPGAAAMLDTKQDSMVRMGFQLAEPVLMDDVIIHAGR